MKVISGTKGVILFIILLVVFGGIFALSLKVYNDRKSDYKETPAVISYVNRYEEYAQIEDEEKTTYYQVFVDYEVDGKEYKKVLYKDDALVRYAVGQEVKILYKVDEPGKIVTKTDNAIMPFVSGGLFLIVCGFGVYGVINTIVSKNSKETKKKK